VIVTQLDMDLKMAQEILEGLGRVSPDSRILVPTVFDNLHFLKPLSRMAIDAHVHKSSFPQELVETIDALSRQAGGHNAVIAMPRGMLERLEGEAVGAHRRGRRRFWCRWPVASPAIT
jgi:DNA-binding NarL/FixJ family response regulator